jgi:hypothetical protein
MVLEVLNIWESAPFVVFFILLMVGWAVVLKSVFYVVSNYVRSHRHIQAPSVVQEPRISSFSGEMPEEIEQISN